MVVLLVCAYHFVGVNDMVASVFVSKCDLPPRSIYVCVPFYIKCLSVFGI